MTTLRQLLKQLLSKKQDLSLFDYAFDSLLQLENKIDRLEKANLTMLRSIMKLSKSQSSSKINRNDKTKVYMITEKQDVLKLNDYKEPTYH